MDSKIGPWAMGKYTYSALVVNVVDGDTLDLRIDLGFSVHINTRVRLEGVDAYEIRLGKNTTPKKKALGLKAKEFVKQEIEGHYVQVTTHKTGKYGRYIAMIKYIKSGHSTIKDLSSELVRLGYAVYKDY